MSGIRMKTKDVVVCGLLASMLLVTQVALSFLPNIEVVSLLVLVYTLVLGRKTLIIIYAFALLEGIFYGFASGGLCIYMYGQSYIWLSA